MKKKSVFAVLGNWGKIAIVPAVLLTSLLFSGCGKPEFKEKPVQIEESKDSVQNEKIEESVSDEKIKELKHSEDNEKPEIPINKVVEKVGPSVVNIVTNNKRGSGIIFSKDGYIITNDHVVRGANAIEVHLADTRTLKAKPVGTDSRMDLAVIRVEGNDLPVANFTDSAKVEKGETVIAIGNAKGNENSVTKGIISNLNIDVDDGTNIKRCIQTDASINAGNSGGALMNMKGEVIGITAMVRNNAENIGYAIPSSDAKDAAEQLINKGYISWPYLGIEAVREDVDGDSLIWVRNVMPDSPAAKAGLREYDVIVNVNDVRVPTVSKLREQLSISGIGSMVSIHVARSNGKDVEKGTIQVKLEELPKGYYTIDWS